jgi:hypothetical protein
MQDHRGSFAAFVGERAQPGFFDRKETDLGRRNNCREGNEAQKEKIFQLRAM